MNTNTIYEKVDQLVSIFLRGKNYYANWQLNNKQHRISLKTNNKKVAARKALELEQKILSGENPKPPKPALIEDVIQDFLNFHANEGKAPKTLAKYKIVCRRISNLCSKQNIHNLSQFHVKFLDSYRKKRTADGAQPKTIYNESIIVKQLENFAQKRGLITKRQLETYQLKKPKPTQQPCWSYTQLERIISQCDDVRRQIFTVLADTDMRIGELKHLTHQDVDWQNKCLYIRPKGDWKPKTGDIRTVPMNERVFEIIRNLPKNSKWLFTSPKSGKYPKGDHQISERRLLKYLKVRLEKLNFTGHLHTFRHTFISLAADSEQLRMRCDIIHDVKLIAPYNKRNHKVSAKKLRPREYTWYRNRYKVERSIAWITCLRRLDTRYEYYPNIFLGFCQLGCLLTILKGL